MPNTRTHMPTSKPDALALKLGRNIRQMRYKRKLSASEAAKKHGVSRRYYLAIEKGQNLTISSLYKIAKTLRCKPSDLLP